MICSQTVYRAEGALSLWLLFPGAIYYIFIFSDTPARRDNYGTSSLARSQGEDREVRGF